MCDAGRFRQELPRMPDVTFIIYDSLDLMVEVAELRKSVPNYQAEQAIRDMKDREAWGYQKWIKEGHAEVGIYLGKYTQVGDSVVRHEMNHVDCDVLTNYLKGIVTSEHFCMLQDMRETETIDMFWHLHDYIWDDKTEKEYHDSELRLYTIETF